MGVERRRGAQGGRSAAKWTDAVFILVNLADLAGGWGKEKYLDLEESPISGRLSILFRLYL